MSILSENPSAEGKYRQWFTVRPEQADCYHTLFPNYLLWMLQECSVNHVEAAHMGYDALIPRQLAWALAGFELEVRGLPQWKQSVSVDTWHKKSEGLFSYRDYQMRNQKGDCLVNASSTWFIMDLQKRKAIPASKVFPDLPVVPESALDSLLRRSALGDPPDQPADYTSRHRVLFTDLDHNGHCNNVHYIRWMFYDLPASFLKEHLLQHFEIYFVKELNEGEAISERTWIIDGEKSLF